MTITEQIQAYYTDRLARYGDTVEALGWNAENQRRRFELLCQGWDLSAHPVVLDVGCGRADLFAWLMANHYQIRYRGIDVVPALVDLAKRKHGFANDVVWVADVETAPLPACDYAVCSGLFNLNLGDYGFRSAQLMRRVLERVWAICRRGMSFDCLSSDREDQVEGQWYASPHQVTEWIDELRPSGTITRFDQHAVHGNLIVQLTKGGTDA